MPTLTWDERRELALRFLSRLVLFPEEQTRARPGKQNERIGDYHPRGVELLLERGVISIRVFKPRRPATLDALAACTRDDDQLCLLGRLLPNPDYAWKMYFDILDRARFPLTTYARVQTRGEALAASRDPAKIGKDDPVWSCEVGRPFFQPGPASDDDISIQYWFCYFYDDWANQHEGDWEGICVFLRRDHAGYTPVGASYYAHETGKRRHWSEVERATTDGTHPLIFVAAGSHASYFQFVDGGYLTTVKNLIVPVLGLKMAFPGTWGVRLLGGLIYGGPQGPSHKGLKWHNPFAWMERYCTPDYLVY